MKKSLINISYFSAVALAIGETVVVITKNKYIPLAIDDYFAVILLVIAATFASKRENSALLLATWTYIFGNMYSMLFNRLHPVFGSKQRIPLLAGIVIVSGVIAVLCLIQVLKEAKTTKDGKESESEKARNTEIKSLQEATEV